MMKNRCFRKSKNNVFVYCQDLVLDLLFLFFRIFPIENDKIVITCFKNLGFCDSPKYIALALINQSVHCKLVWLCDDEQKSELPNSIKQVPYYSFRGIYEQVTARIWISNRRRSRYVHKRKGQYYLQTWHGGIGLKNIERAAETVLSKRYCKGAKRDSKMIDLFLSNSNFSTRIIHRDMWYKGLVLQKGLPRNDILLNGNHLEIASEVRAQFHIPNDSIVILYAPTFRADMLLNHNTLQYDRILSELECSTKKHWVMLVRYHTNVSGRLQWNSSISSVINVSSFLDVQKLLITSQVLISDYSSIIFDFALMDKPIIQYIADIETYELDRGMRQSVEDLPFIKTHSQQELIQQLSHVKLEEKYPYRKWMEKNYGLTETGFASERSAEVIEHILKGS